MTSELQDTISDISSWMTANLPYLNPSKTELMLIGLPQLISKISNPSLPSFKSLYDTYRLGPQTRYHLWFNLHLFQKQISSLSSACNYHISDLRRISHTLDLKTAIVIATSRVHPKLLYCNSLYLNVPHKQISRLQLLQNSLARAVAGTPKIEPRYSNLCTGSA